VLRRRALTNRVFREEIIPLIDRNYRTTADRGIFGHSYGGLFANYLLFADPDLFQRYAITSPSLWWDGDAIFDLEAAFAKTHTSLRKQVYFSIGSLEGGAMEFVSQKMAATLRARHYQGLDLVNVELPGAYHSSMAEYSRALDMLYPVRWGIYSYGDSAVNDSHAVSLRPIPRRLQPGDAHGRRHLASDSAFQAIVDDRPCSGLTATRRSWRNGLLSAGTGASHRHPWRRRRRPSKSGGTFTETTTAHSGHSVVAHGRLMLELRRRHEGWRIIYVLHEPQWPAPVTTVVSVTANGTGVAHALVEGFDDRGKLATARTDSAGIAHLPYDWHVSRGGYTQVQAPGYALAMVPLADRDSVSIVIKKVITLNTAAIDAYVGTFVSPDQSVVLRLTRDGRRLLVERLRTANASRRVSFTHHAGRARRIEIVVTLDASGHVIELLRGDAPHA
jgi:hypothetical protein